MYNLSVAQWSLSGLVVSALGIRARGPGFESRVAPLFHLVATLGKLFTHTHCLPSFSAPANWGTKRELSALKLLWWLSALSFKLSSRAHYNIT